MRGLHDVRDHSMVMPQAKDHGTSCYAVIWSSIALVDIIKFYKLNIDLIGLE